MRKLNWAALLAALTVLVAIVVGIDAERVAQAQVLALCAIALAILSFRE